MIEYHLNGALGPNRCEIEHNVSAQKIIVRSEKDILVQDMREIESRLGLNTILGWRGNIVVEKSYLGTITCWSYLEACDCDWS